MWRALLAALLLSPFFASCGAFKVASRWRAPRVAQSVATAAAANSLESLSDHARQATELSTAVSMWLNAEYAQDSSHEAVAELIRREYLESRLRGVNSTEQLLAHMLVKVNESSEIKGGLMQSCMVVSKVEDVLSILAENARLANGTGPRESAPRNPNLLRLEELDDHSVWDVKHVQSLSRALSSAFERYKLLRDFLEGEDVWDEMNVLIALTLGFRLQRSSAFSLVEELAPMTWTALRRPVLFNTTHSLPLYDKMAADIAEHEGGIGKCTPLKSAACETSLPPALLISCIG